jgi:hypothetical protein
MVAPRICSIAGLNHRGRNLDLSRNHRLIVGHNTSVRNKLNADNQEPHGSRIKRPWELVSLSDADPSCDTHWGPQPAKHLPTLGHHARPQGLYWGLVHTKLRPKNRLGFRGAGKTSYGRFF